MGLFAKRTPAPEAEAPLEDRLIEAEQQVKLADGVLSRIAARYHALQQQFNLVVDAFGTITNCAVPDHDSRAWLENQVRQIVTDKSKATAEFHKKLSQWAGLKSAAEGRQ